MVCLDEEGIDKGQKQSKQAKNILAKVIDDSCQKQSILFYMKTYGPMISTQKESSHKLKLNKIDQTMKSRAV